MLKNNPWLWTSFKGVDRIPTTMEMAMEMVTSDEPPCLKHFLHVDFKLKRWPRQTKLLKPFMEVNPCNILTSVGLKKVDCHKCNNSSPELPIRTPKLMLWKTPKRTIASRPLTSSQLFQIMQKKFIEGNRFKAHDPYSSKANSSYWAILQHKEKESPNLSRIPASRSP